MKKLTCLLSLVSCLCATGAMANWEYPGTYVGDGYYFDDGTRFVVGVRGGATYGMGSVKNAIGTLYEQYYDWNESGELIAVGEADLGSLTPVDNLSGIAFVGGASIGVTLPGVPQWRLEAGWDHMSEIDYNVSPLFRGEITLFDGATATLDSGYIQSSVATDVFSVMAYYDFFEGLCKPVGEFIPYIGFGVGYADSTTILNMTDYSGYELVPEYGTVSETSEMITFYNSEYSSGNVAGVAALGLSYGLTEYTYLDLSARVTYIPSVKFMLANEDNSRHRDWFSVDSLIYVNAYLGLRFEF